MTKQRHAWMNLLTIAAALSLCAARGEAAGYGSPPLRFEENVGQVDAQVAYLMRGAHHRVFLTQQGATLDLDGVDAMGRPARAAVRMRVVGAREAVRPRGEGRLASSTRYVLAGQQELRAAHFGRVRYPDVLPGIDLVYYGDPQRLEYDFVLQPGAAPQSIGFTLEGADEVVVNASGAITIRTSAGEARLQAPFAYQMMDRVRRRVEARYELQADNRVSFKVGAYDEAKELVIDPVLVYAGYLGGGGADIHTAIKVNEAGEAHIVGATRSLDFPATAGAVQGTPAGGRCGGSLVSQTCFDVFAAKLSANGSRVEWATYYGGTGDDRPADAALGPDGSLYIVGTTDSTDFPVSAGAVQPASTDAERPAADAFLLRIGPQGGRVFSTLLGGSRADNGTGVDVDGAGVAYVAGHTFSNDLPFPAGIVASRKSGPPERSDVFVAAVTGDGGSIAFGAYLGGALDERAGDVAVLQDGRLAVTGSTSSTNFPVTDAAFQPQLDGSRADAFVTIYRGGAREFSSYFGGSGVDAGTHIEADEQGGFAMIGSTDSRDFPTTSTGPLSLWKRSLGFVAHFAIPGARPQLSSYVVGTADEMAVGADGAIYVAGVTAASSPLFGESAAGGCEGSLLRKILPTGRLAYSGFVSGLGAIDVDGEGAVYSAATDVSGAQRTTAGVFDAVHAGQSDVYVAKLELEEEQTISLTCVEHGASLTPGEVAPGEIVSLFGTGLGPDIPAGVVVENGVVQNDVAGARVLFNGVPGPLLFVWFNQINAVAPYSLEGAETAVIEVEYDGVKSNALELPVTGAHPGLFTRDATGHGVGALFNEDGTKNYAENPAEAGSVIQLFGTGEGQTSPPGIDGLVAPEALSSLARPRQDVKVKIGGKDAEVLYAGAAPGLVSGVLQINVRIPADTPAGEAALQVTIGGKLNRQAVSVVVK